MKYSLRPNRRRSSQTGPGISLFPFLAVLICMMGALVPLLLAITRTARIQAAAAAAAKAAEAMAKASEETRTQLEDSQWRMGQLKQSRRQTEAQLADARLELGHLEDHARRLRTQLAQYQQTVDEFDRLEHAGRQQIGQEQAELERTRTQISAARRQVDDARNSAMSRNRSYAIIPYEGPNQTHRRPIYIECLANAIVLQPEGIALTGSDFEGPLGPGNPLAAALRAAREYLLGGRDFDPQVGEPYPMLLVRPEGITAFYIARAALKSWGGDFGYELIGDDWRLAYQPRDPRLSQVVQQAIASARVYQEQLIAAAPRQYGPKTTSRAAGSGGFAPDGGGEGDDDRGYASAKPAGAVAGNRGTAGSDQGASGRGSGNGEYNPYVTMPDRSEAGGPRGNRPNGSAGLPYGNAVAGGNAAGGNGTGGNAAGGNGTGGYGTGGNAAGENATGGNGMGGNGTGGAAGNGSDNAAGLPYGNGGNNGNGTGGYATSGNGAGGTASGRATAGGASGNSASSATDTNANSSHQGEKTERAEGYVVGQPPRELPPSNALRDSPQSDAVPSEPLRPGEWEPTPEQPPKDKHDKDKDDDEKAGKRPKPKSLVSNRGSDWGLRGSGRNAVGLTRPMRIECHADRFVVIADRGPAGNKVVPLGSRTTAAIDPFISAVWGEMESWGMAGRGMYWRPVLQVTVAPDAERRYADLSALLEGSGLAVERR